MVLVGAPPLLVRTPSTGNGGQTAAAPPLSSTLQRPPLLAFFGGQPASQAQRVAASRAPPTPTFNGAGTSSPGSKFTGLRDESRRVGLKSQFVKKASTAAFARKVSTTLATFLPTGLLRQLSGAVLDASVNPRLPAQCPGVYLVISLTGLHTLPEFPIDDDEVARRVRHIYEVVAARIHEDGGQVMRLTGDTCLACWALKPQRGEQVSADALRGASEEGDPAPTQITAFNPQQVRAATHAAATAALSILQELHGYTLWSAEEQRAAGGAGGSAGRTDGGSIATPATSTAGRSLFGDDDEDEEAEEAEDAGRTEKGEGGGPSGADQPDGTAEAPARADDEPSSDGGSMKAGNPLGGSFARSGKKWGSTRSLLGGASNQKGAGLIKGSTASIARGDTKGSGNSGLSFLDAVNAANKAEEDGGLISKLEMGAALTISAAQAMHVGGANGRWEYVVCAPEISDAQQILANVLPGQALVSEDLREAFPLGTLQQHMTTDAWWILADADDLHPANADIEKARRFELVQALPAAAMRSYVPGSMWARVHEGDPERIISLSDVRAAPV